MVKRIMHRPRKKERGIVKIKSRKMLDHIRAELSRPCHIYQALIKPSPPLRDPCLIITPSVLRTRKLQIKQIIIFNKILKITSLAGIRSKRTTFMTLPRSDSIKITNYEPRKVNSREFRKLIPQVALRLKVRCIIDDRDNPV